jgi:hypothetical protein
MVIVHIRLDITLIQCSNVLVLQCFTVEDKPKGLDYFQKLGWFRLEYTYTYIYIYTHTHGFRDPYVL